MSEAVLLEREGAIATIVLNRPEVLNALNDKMVEGLLEAVTAVENDEAIRCVVIRGAGGSFIAGGDLKQFHEFLTDSKESGDEFPIKFEQVHSAIEIIRTMPKPVIASVHGPAAGFGVSLLSACDLVIAAENALFTLAYCLIGTSPDGGSTFHLPRAVGIKRAMEIAMLGDFLDADKALELGLINKVVPAADLAAETAKLAARLAKGPTHALANTKRLLNESFHSNLHDQLAREAEGFIDCTSTADFMEGISAFLEKRKAEFKGR
ncbi:MAG: enoyl-CoA hydratase/isomerase family protein [Sphingomonadales bacterium]